MEHSINYDTLYSMFLAKLKMAREDAGLTQVQVAEKLNKSQSYVSKCENGDLKVDIVELMSFARIYKKPLDYFIADLGDSL